MKVKEKQGKDLHRRTTTRPRTDRTAASVFTGFSPAFLRRARVLLPNQCASLPGACRGFLPKINRDGRGRRERFGGLDHTAQQQPQVLTLYTLALCLYCGVC
jgi:hypothetical protein